MISNPVDHWTGEEGNSYIKRREMSADVLLPTYTHMWSRILARTRGIKTVLEVGASVGLNLRAIKRLMPRVLCSAIEPNLMGRAALLNQKVDVYDRLAEGVWGDIGQLRFDLVFTRGVLIHIDPAQLKKVYSNIEDHSARYVMFAEYFSPVREVITYRGKGNLLWRADYAWEFMRQYPEFELVDYFFIYSRDKVAPQDNVTVFLMEKVA